MMEKQKMTMGKAISLSALIACATAEAQTIHFQGRVLDAAGNPRQGTIHYYITSANVSGPLHNLGPNGEFDLTFDAAGGHGFAPVYYAPGSVITGDIEYRSRLFTVYDADQQLETYDPIKGHPLPEDFASWCGLELKVITPGAANTANVVAWDRTHEECPDADPANLNTVISRQYTAGNLVSNGSFESNYNLPNAAPAVSDYDLWDASGLTLTAQPAHRANSGRKSAAVQLSASGPAETALLRSDYFPVEPNTPYTLFFRYTASGVSGSVKPMVKNYSQRLPSSESADMPIGRHGSVDYANQSSWTLYRHPFTTGPAGAYATVELVRTAAAGAVGTFQFDDVVVFKGDVDAAYLENHVMLTQSFFDGMNRFRQKAVADGNNDIVAGDELDALGRVVKKILPVSSDFQSVNGRHDFVPDFLEAHAKAYYSPTGSGPDAEEFPYSSTEYEASPLGRRITANRAGGPWNLPDASQLVRSLQTDYASVANLDYVGTCLNTDGTPKPIADCNELPARDQFVTRANAVPPTIPGSGRYFYTLNTGEDLQMQREFTDILGHVVRRGLLVRSFDVVSATGSLVRRFEDENHWSETDYAYDANGNLAAITSPPGPGGERLVRSMAYNSFGQMVSETMPNGTGLTRTAKFIYDRAGRLRFVQSERQRTEGRFDYRKYDVFGRMIESGEYLDDAGFLQARADQDGFPDVVSEPSLVQVKSKLRYDDAEGGGTGGPILVAADPAARNPWESASLNEGYQALKTQLLTSGSPPATATIYQIYTSALSEFTPAPDEFTSITLPSGATVEVDFLGLLKDSPDYVTLEAQAGAAFQISQWAKGRLVESISYNMDTDGAGLIGSFPLTSRFKYDKFGNILQKTEENPYAQAADQVQRQGLEYDVGNRLVRKVTYQGASTAIGSEERYEYDNLGRLATVRDGSGSALVKRTYNGIGQVIRKDLGQQNALVETYGYNLQGWTSEHVARKASGGTNLFREVLRYQETGELPFPRFSGSISEYEAYHEDGQVRGSAYFYTGAGDALTGVWSFSGTGSSLAFGDRNSEFRHFDNGALKSLGREEDPNYATEISLTPIEYYPGTNMAKRLTGTGKIGSAESRYLGAASNFSYDGEGNVSRDLSRGTSFLTYNDANQPILIEYPSGSETHQAVMVYDASGRRAVKEIFRKGIAPAPSVPLSLTVYTTLGKEIRYDFGTNVKTEVFDLADAGRVVAKNGNAYREYYIRNYMGSTVKSVRDESGTPIEFSTAYWPYGKQDLIHGTQTDDVTPKFSGKEHDDGTELDYFGARYYDADLGIWMAADPARQFLSPYSYGDPINEVDWMGLEKYQLAIYMMNAHEEETGRQEIVSLKQVLTPKVLKDAEAQLQTTLGKDFKMKILTSKRELQKFIKSGEYTAVVTHGGQPDGKDKYTQVASSVKPPWHMVTFKELNDATKEGGKTYLSSCWAKDNLDEKVFPRLTADQVGKEDVTILFNNAFHWLTERPAEAAKDVGPVKK